MEYKKKQYILEINYAGGTVIIQDGQSNLQTPVSDIVDAFLAGNDIIVISESTYWLKILHDSVRYLSIEETNPATVNTGDGFCVGD